MSDFGLESLPQRAPRSIGPWSADHLNRVLVGNASGLVLVATSWWQVSGSGSERTQLTWFIVGIAGLVVSGLSNGTWLLRGLQTVSAGRDLVLPRLLRAGHSLCADAAGGAVGALVVVVGTHRYHRDVCPLVSGKVIVAFADVDAVTLAPCEVCQPS